MPPTWPPAMTRLDSHSLALIPQDRYGLVKSSSPGTMGLAGDHTDSIIATLKGQGEHCACDYASPPRPSQRASETLARLQRALTAIVFLRDVPFVKFEKQVVARDVPHSSAENVFVMPLGCGRFTRSITAGVERQVLPRNRCRPIRAVVSSKPCVTFARSRPTTVGCRYGTAILDRV